MLTRAAIREMVVPSLLPVLSPVVLFFVIRVIAGKAQAFACVGAMLLGVILTGLYVAVSMTSGGGAGTTPRSTSRTAITAARAPTPTRRR